MTPWLTVSEHIYFVAKMTACIFSGLVAGLAVKKLWRHIK